MTSVVDVEQTDDVNPRVERLSGEVLEAARNPPTDRARRIAHTLRMTNSIGAANGGLGLPGVHHGLYSVDVDVVPAFTNRDRLSCLFRPFLAIPHLILVGGPVAFALSLVWNSDEGSRMQWGAGGGVLGVVAFVVAVIAWFAIVFGGRYPDGLYKLAAFYLRWRVRAVAYLMLLRDEYPPFGDGDYPATLSLAPPLAERSRLTVAFRPILAIPHLIVLAFLGFAWALATIVAWLSILITGDHPPRLYRFGAGVLRWSARVEAYALLLCDDYPPFSLE